MSIPVTGVSELVLEVADLESAEQFYAGALGMPVVERWPERKAIWVMAGERTRIGLWNPQIGVAGGRGGAHVHFALHLGEGDFDAAVARLRERGLQPQVEAHRNSRSRSAYALDPDGNCVELWTRDVSELLRGSSAPDQVGDEARSPAHFDATAAEWDASYDQASVRGHWWRTRLRAAVALLGDGPGSLLEVGIGSGRLLAALGDRGWTVAGVDAAPRMVELARARMPAAAGALIVARAEQLPFADSTFDAVVVIGVLEYTIMEASLRELVRVLRPGGRAVIGLRNGRSPLLVWQRAVYHPAARAVKRVVPFGQLPMKRRRPLSLREARDVLGAAGLAVDQIEHVGCAVLLYPLDRLAPRLAYRAARLAESSPGPRRLFSTQRVLRATKA